MANYKDTLQKKELLDFIRTITNNNIRNVDPYSMRVLHTLEYMHYTDVLNKINIRKNKINNLISPNPFLAFYIPNNKSISDISKGCSSCLSNKVTHIRHSTKCNTSCDFCYYYGDEQGDVSRMVPFWAYRHNSLNLSSEEMAILLEKQYMGHIDAVGWLDKEPLLNPTKMEYLMKFLAPKNIYQYLYTNGILATKETLLKLKDWGLNEIRFNLQATDFSDKVIKNMETACKLFDNVIIETPMYSKTYNNFIRKKKRILNSGITQINIPELQLSPFNLNLFEEEGIIYRHRRGYTSPVSSRNYTYDLLEKASEEYWDIIINDCSNDTKFFRGINVKPDGGINYSTRFTLLPPSYYYWVIENYVNDTLEVF